MYVKFTVETHKIFCLDNKKKTAVISRVVRLFDVEWNKTTTARLPLGHKKTKEWKKLNKKWQKL